MPSDLPSGTVTFLFTDIEGSTKLLNSLGAEAYADALSEHRRVLRAAFAAHGGVEVDTQGDAFFVAFPTAPGALAAAAQAREGLDGGPIRVRIGIHTGTPHLTDEGYAGPDVHRAARIAAAGHGGQVLVSASTAALLDGAELRDLGLHRLKDLTAAERIHQLGDGEHPPLKTLHQTNLPVPATTFLGRDVELRELSALLARDDARLVTLTGPGGTGKTRLALQAAASAADHFAGGVWWVALAPLRDPALVLESAARALGASGDLAEHIGDSALLLLLDNFEHLLDAAAGLAPLLSRCPNLTLLVTSRERLHLDGEHEYAVDPLTPDEAVELFKTRATSARRDFTDDGAVALVCERLDHLPLAIELAAARVRILSPKALLDRLEQRLPLLADGNRDAPERQRTLRATIEWSHELLTDVERHLFARLAVFRGGCTLEAAEAVAGADLETLQSLVDKSLVRARGDRFWMLETIREFAVERLLASGEAGSLRDRHAQHFLGFAEEAEPHLRGNPKVWLDRLDADLDNIRASQDWLSQRGLDHDEVRMVAALWRLWMNRGNPAEGLRRMGVVRAGGAPGTPERAMALNGLTAISMTTGDWQTGAAAAEEALALHRRYGNDWGVANTTFLLGHVAAEKGEYASARERFIDSLARFRQLDDTHYVLLAMRNLATSEYELGNRDAAEALHRDVIDLARETGNVRMEASSLGALAEYAILDGRPEESLDLLREGTRITHSNGDGIESTINLRRYARALVQQGQVATGIRILGAAHAANARMGVARVGWVKDLDEGTLEIARTSLSADEVEALRSEGRTMSLDEAVAALLGD